MKHLGEKEQIDITINSGQSTKAVVFAKTYTEIPKVLIIGTSGAVDVPASVTITGCNINAINSKTDTKANTNGRTIKLSIIE